MSCQIAMALRPWLRPSSVPSRNGSHKLMDGTGWGDSCSESLNSTPNPVVTAFSLAGFAVAFVFSFEERFSKLGVGLTVLAGSVAPDPVVASVSLAGFAGARRPQAPSGRTQIPAAFR